MEKLYRRMVAQFLGALAGLNIVLMSVGTMMAVMSGEHMWIYVTLVGLIATFINLWVSYLFIYRRQYMGSAESIAWEAWGKGVDSAYADQSVQDDPKREQRLFNEWWDTRKHS
jgi:hypothetical protein